VSEKPVFWVGDSKKRLVEFPQDVRVAIGHALSEAQNGRKADYAKPLKGIDGGVFEIVSDHDTDTYRGIYAVKLGEHIYVLHAFKKKSKSGIATPKPDVELIKTRLRQVKAQLGFKT
jgi:phage-related protein